LDRSPVQFSVAQNLEISYPSEIVESEAAALEVEGVFDFDILNTSMTCLEVSGRRQPIILQQKSVPDPATNHPPPTANHGYDYVCPTTYAHVSMYIIVR
jgi:hypothetical protein